jgi:NADH-quinone oxidoreductase subunit L
VVTIPLILLAIPSVLIGFFTVGPMLFGDFFRGAIEVMPAHDTVAAAAKTLWHDEHGWLSAAVRFGLHSVESPVFWLAFFGFASATALYLFFPDTATKMRASKPGAFLTRVLENKYGFDDLWIKGFAGGGIKLGKFSWKRGDAGLIDGLLVNGSAVLVDRIAGIVRHLQTGRLYNYAFAMIIGLIVLLAVLVRTVGA